jgi:hypothetical protein
MPTIIRTSIPQITAAIRQALQEVVEETADNAKNNIEQETYRRHGGRDYPSRREPGVMHRASAPGESFASDTASLVSGIEIERFGMTNWINFGDSLGIHRWNIFEFGGTRIGARPTIVPVMEHMRDGFIQDCARAALGAATENAVK